MPTEIKHGICGYEEHTFDRRSGEITSTEVLFLEPVPDAVALATLRKLNRCGKHHDYIKSYTELRHRND
jgi:hypothetical protein